MTYSIDFKQNAIKLRNQGYSIKEIADKFKISKSTASLWCSGIELDEHAQNRLAERKILGQYKSIEIATKKRKLAEEKRIQQVSQYLSKIKMSKELAKLCCALLFWCEGSKSKISVRFTSSDPSLIGLFLSLFRTGYSLEERKFRALVHVHEYHDEPAQKLFWSRITGIPLLQFHRSYKKPNTGKRKHDNYPGCLSVTYYDANLAKELATIYNVFTQRGVVQW